MPALLRVVGETPQRAVGTNVTVGFFVGVAGSLAPPPRARRPTSALIAAGGAASIPGALLGSRLTGRLSEPAADQAIAVVLLIAAAGCSSRPLT